MLNEKSYLELMTPFLPFLKTVMRSSERGTAYYGTGEAAHWPVQSNFNVAGALGVVATTEEKLPFPKDEFLELALRFFRYGLETHITNGMPATDGKCWGNSWIAVLGLERAAHGFNALAPYMTGDDREKFWHLRLNESDWLLNYPVKAAMTGASGENRPESNIWNGGFLLRTAVDYPDAPNHDAYLEKACAFLLNGLSHPLDAASETLYRGRPLREWHAGFNFTPNYSLDHHGYMNVGYSAISLSNLAMLHFWFKEKGMTPPDELYLHVRDLWNVMRNFVFDDGRLLRIGGDSRSRYTYCQNYMLPVLLFVQDLFGEASAVMQEDKWLKIVQTERSRCYDGSFFGERLSSIRRGSWYYYTRLESDAFLSLSCGAYWRRKFALMQPSASSPVPQTSEWNDDYHFADLQRTGSTIRSAVRKGAEGPVLLCLPADRSDLAEWSGNGFARVSGYCTGVKFVSGFHKKLPGGFLNAGKAYWVEDGAWGEGEEHYDILESRSAVAALPDGRSMIVLEQLRVMKECTLESVRGIAWKVPNDVFNGMKRSFRGENFKSVLESFPKQRLVETHSGWLNVDNCFSLILGYGADSLKISSPEERQGEIHSARALRSLYMHEICSSAVFENRRFMKGEMVADTAYAAVAGATSEETPAFWLKKVASPKEIRCVEFQTADGRKFRFSANFSDKDIQWDSLFLAAGTCVLESL